MIEHRPTATSDLSKRAHVSLGSMGKKSSAEPLHCPCGSEVPFAACCEPYLAGAAICTSAESLMRSRYCAFVRTDADYLLKTWHPKTRPSRVKFDPDLRWLGLRIRATSAGGADDSEGIVEFVARCKTRGRGQRLHEVSRFSKIDGRWYYIDGDHL